VTIDEIDFGRLYREHLAACARTPKTASAWDGRAGDAHRGQRRSHYAGAFIARMDLGDATTLLDVGCGPGTIGLPLAERLDRVYGLDFSRTMLDALLANAAARGLANVEALHLAWEDDWARVPECDIVVASRSTQVADMAAALAKLDAKARRRVYLTHRAGNRSVLPEVLALLGRRRVPPPDYIYIVNILHGMGIQPRLDYIEGDGRPLDATDCDDFVRSIAWSLGDLSAEDASQLRAWYERHKPASAFVPSPLRWAFVSWEKRPTD
jgi:SAM-dependent methyltransferase